MYKFFNVLYKEKISRAALTQLSLAYTLKTCSLLNSKLLISSYFHLFPRENAQSRT